ncbi:hypothetical protein LTS18_006379 [Coniosporium uncinatum]|uniref:Uncharacterized protein n=1 Tax=Coniosporium uncinatum TaxID=93489 RepID=A0ACC3DQT5_9PEZI|nr:hypothetical protein LTS18_006379 [Coniosporium uncinatum]
MEEVPTETKYGFAQLALFYALINNTVFVLYRLADPGTIQLIKSGTTLITALVIYCFLGTRIVRGQWLAILLQVCGIVVTQYDPKSGAAYPLATYVVLLFQTFISAVSSVYNQTLCKSSDASLHAMNMNLYGAGVCVNLFIHALIRVTKPGEPGFFEGYGHTKAVMVIISNTFLGLIMTAVYKYADAVIKCFATAIATAILLYLSPILFQADLSFLVLPGTVVVFIATWLYMENTPRKGEAPMAVLPVSVLFRAQSKTLRLLESYSAKGAKRNLGLGICTGVAVSVIAGLTIWDSRNGAFDSSIPTSSDTASNEILESPFRNTYAFIRINFDNPERPPVLRQGYEPFFHTTHISMPNAHSQPSEWVNLTDDAYHDSHYPYKPLADTMSLILESEDPHQQEVEGILFFHFDAWVFPMRFADMDFDQAWFPGSGDPHYLCMNNTEAYGEWMWHDLGYHEQALQAVSIVKNMETGYVVDEHEWCNG